MMQRIPRWILCSAISGVLAASAHAAFAGPAASQAGIDRLKSEHRGAKVSVSPATGSARFVRLGPASMLRLGTSQVQAARNAAAFEATASSFLDRHAAAFGLANGSSDLALRKAETDAQGWTRLTYAQQYRGLPVFGATLKTHFDASGRLTVVNGAIIPDIDVSTTPSRSARDAEATAVSHLKRKGMSASQSRLLIYREGLAKGVPGANHLAYEVVVTNNRIREFVYVDAHTGKFIDRISGTPDAMNRRAYDAQNQPAPGPNYPGSPYWVEGNPFPTASTEANNMIAASQETYDLFSDAFGRDSFDDAGATMDSIFNRGNACPNASWNGIFISFCPGTTSDDVTGHEWGHAYTEYTDGLIYAWQPGALNEAASDVFGETVDLLNGRQTDTPNNPRTLNACTAFTPLPPAVVINSPAAIAGQKPSGGSAYGPQTFNLTNDVVLVDDGTGSTNPPSGAAGDLSVMDGCETPFTNAAAVNGKIALMYRGTCGFVVKSKNAQLNGAVGVIIANHTLGGNGAFGMAGVDPTVVIPTLSLGNANGEAVRNALASTTVNATLSQGGVGTDNSVRWLMGEDATAFGGAIRDMASPNCYLNPAKVTDSLYHCAASDNGGVHINSGVDNRAYSLLVDGGTFNGQTVAPIGLTKAAHIWYQAKVAYQHPATDFADHADALEQSCTDLIGVNLNSLTGGGPSGQVISAADCAQVEKAVDAVEFRTPPAQCNFQPILAQGAPAICPPGKSAKKLFVDNFENGTASLDRFVETHTAVFPADFTPRDWVVTGELPDGRPGRAFFGVDYQGGTCAPGGDESGVLHLDSPVITLPNTAPAPRIAFDHWVATEAGWDGGNVKISVNGGAWQVIPAAAFIYNDYNAVLNAAPANTNPLAGQPAFTGSDGGSVGGSWGTSIIDLTGIANKKDRIQLRFDIGTDGCSGTFGWYVDDLQVVQCR